MGRKVDGMGRRRGEVMQRGELERIWTVVFDGEKGVR